MRARRKMAEWPRGCWRHPSPAVPRSARLAVSLPPSARAGPRVLKTRPGRLRGERCCPPSRLPPGPSVPAADSPGSCVRPRPCAARRLRRERRRPESTSLLAGPETAFPRPLWGGRAGRGAVWEPGAAGAHALSPCPGKVRRVADACLFLKPQGPRGEQAETAFPGTGCGLERKDSGDPGAERPAKATGGWRGPGRRPRGRG